MIFSPFPIGASSAPGGSALLHLSRSTPLFAALIAFAPLTAQAQTPAISPGHNAPASPEAAPAPVEAAPIETAPIETAPAEIPVTEMPPAPPETQTQTAPELAPEILAPAGSTRDLPAPATPLSRLFAPDISYRGGLIIAQGSAESPVRFETTAGRISALQVTIDTLKQVVDARGAVRLERESQNSRRLLTPRGLKRRRVVESPTETLVGENLHFSFKNQQGTLDGAEIQLAAFFVTAQSLEINGRRYSAQNVLLRPGGLSPAETKIYGTPPLSIRAKSLVATLPDPASGAGNSAAQRPNLVARGGGLYFRNTRILPLPAYVFRAGLGGGGGTQSAFKLTPGVSFNSADRVLVTTRLGYPLSKTPGQLTAFADIGLSQRVGVRGGVGLESESRFGSLTLRARRADVIQTQLTNRIELDRKPEIIYDSPALLTFDLPGGRRGGFTLGASYGDYGERRIGDDSGSIDATRLTTRLLFTTRLRASDGPFLRLFALDSRYGGIESRYRNRGIELGYDGQLLRRVRGQITLRSTSLSGQTPFRFDRVEIARELRSTFDVTLTPRYLLPVDLRYDLNRRTFRDASFGILRSYKVFAYGLVYQTARQDLRLEVRQGF